MSATVALAIEMSPRWAFSADLETDRIVTVLKEIEEELKSVSVSCDLSIDHRYFPGQSPRTVNLTVSQNMILEYGGRLRVETEGESFRDGPEMEIYPQKTIGVFDGEKTTFMSGAKRYTHGLISSYRNDTQFRIDPRNLTTFYFSEPISKLLLDMKGTVIGKEQWDGDEVIRVETTPIAADAKRKYVFFVNPRVNYAVVRRSAAIQFQGVDRWMEYTGTSGFDYRELHPGIWLPGRVVYESYDPTADIAATQNESPLSWRWNIQLRDWAVNPKVDDTTFQLEFTPGVYVNDKIAGRNYQTAGISDGMIAGQVADAIDFRGSDSVNALKSRRMFLIFNVIGLTAVAAVILAKRFQARNRPSKG